jgi:hypothetical protein
MRDLSGNWTDWSGQQEQTLDPIGARPAVHLMLRVKARFGLAILQRPRPGKMRDA